MTWRDEAACKGQDSDLWHPESRRQAMANYPYTKATCAGCGVSEQCLADAYATGEIYYGMRGGLTARQRQRSTDRVRGRNRTRPRRRIEIALDGGRIVVHGTRSAYKRGCGCDECYAAHSEHRTLREDHQQ